MLQVGELGLQFLDLRFALYKPFVSLGNLLVPLCEVFVAFEHQLLEAVDVVGKFCECHTFVIRDERYDIRSGIDAQEKNADFRKKTTTTYAA